MEESVEKLKSVIEKYKFARCSQDEYLETFDKLSKASSEIHTKDELVQACEALRAQMYDDKFPDDNDYGTFMGKKAAYYIQSTAEDSNIPILDFASDLFKAYLACFPPSGPSTGQITVANELDDILKEYFDVLKGEDLRLLANAYKRNYSAQEADIAGDCTDRFYAVAYSHIQHILRNLLNKNIDDLQSAVEEFIDLYVYAQKSLAELDVPEEDESGGIYYVIARDIKDLFKEEERPRRNHMYDNFTDPSLFKEHIQLAVEFICCETYPREAQNTQPEDWLHIFEDHICVKPEVGKLYLQHLIDAGFQLLNYGTSHSYSKAGDIGRFCRDQLENNKQFLHGITVDVSRVSSGLQNKNKAITDKKLYEAYNRSAEYMCRFVALEVSKSKKDKTDMFMILIAMIGSRIKVLVETAHYVEKELKSKDIKWKEEGNNIILELEALLQTATEGLDDEDFLSWGGSKLADILGHLCDMIKKAKLQNMTCATMIKLIRAGLQNHSKEILVELAEIAANRLQWAAPPLTKDILHSIYAEVTLLLEDEDIIDEDNYDLRALATRCLLGPPESQLVDTEFADDMKTLSAAIVDKSDLDSNDVPTVYAHAKIQILTYMFKNRKIKECVEPFVDCVFAWIEDSEWDQLKSVSLQLGLNAVAQHPLAIGDRMEGLVDIIEENGDASLPAIFKTIHDCSPPSIHPVLPRLVDVTVEADYAVKMGLLTGVINEVAKKNPEVFTEDEIEKLVRLLHNDTDAMLTLMVFDGVVQSKPELFIPHIDTIYSVAQRDQNLLAYACTVAGKIALYDKDTAAVCVEHVIHILSSATSETREAVLAPIKAIGAKFREVLVGYKDTFTALKAEPRNAETCTYILDIIEGRSLEKVRDEIQDQRVELDNVKNDVVVVNKNVTVLDKTVERQRKDMEYVKEDVTKAEKKLKRMDQAVKDTAARVDKLEAMVVVNSPMWSREVANIMNVEDEHDWRLLSLRLGYNKDDIAAWSTQPDPCLAMLNEWFVNKSTSKATKGLLNALEEINRTDAANIVKEALNYVVNSKQDGDSEEELPPVFLSYQWGHQPHVKLLKKHLEMAGFKCWMDTGQMGGGDKLFEKIDAGIRAAKIVICCVSEKYSPSANCNREVNLTVNLWKPIIPLLMEKMAWPPKGAMGPIFGEYLFVRFFQRQAELTGDERYWPVAKMNELLGQLQIYTPPDKSLVAPTYENWWVPKAEQIEIPKTVQTSTPAAATSDENKQENESPAVFISYQWGKQPEVKALYERLTSMGYSCWLDINQMGGGDSLYDKIDKGVRNCHVVVSCVTNKYAISANCRREVSLADALRKPIIPLLLEKMNWPPEGPMSMPFTQLLFINFYRDPDVQTRWDGPKFDELQTKLNEHVPVELMTPRKVGGTNTGSTKPFNAKKEWRKIKHATMATASMQSQYCTLF